MSQRQEKSQLVPTYTIDLCADPSRKLRADLTGREMLIGLQHDAVAEQAALSLVDRPADYTPLPPSSPAYLPHWTRIPGPKRMLAAGSGPRAPALTTAFRPGRSRGLRVR